PDLMTFSIPASGVQTIAPVSPLPAITDPVVIDGYCQLGSSANTLGIGPNTPGHELGDGDNAVLLIQVLGSNAGPNAIGLEIGEAATGTVIRGLVIGNFDGPAIQDDAASSATIAGNFIGTDPSGTISSPNATQAGYTGAIVFANPGGVIRSPSITLTIG